MSIFRTSDGVDIEYESQGEGPAIVLLPGLSMSVWHWSPTFALADRYRVVAMSPRGHGRSGREGPHTHAQIARDVHDLIGHLGLSDVTLVGWSMGAFVVWEYLEAFGRDGVDRVCSVDMTPRNNLVDGWEHVVFGNLDMAGVVAASGAILHDRDGWQRGLTVACFAEGAQVDTATTEDWVREGLRASDSSVLAYWIDLARSDWRPLVERLDLPSLFVQGARSLACPTDIGSYVEQSVPGARVRVFEQSGHAPFWEEPERFNAELADFVADT